MTNKAKPDRSRIEKSVLIVGGNGFIGSSLTRDLAKDHKVYSTFNTRFTEVPGVTYLPTNMNDKDSAKRTAFWAHPNVLIYCAGAYDWKEAEQDEKITQAIHGGGPVNMVTGAEVFKPKIIYLSSDLVFSGKDGNFHEDDTTLPYLQLGKAQVTAETFVRSRSLNQVVLRVSSVLGRGPVDHPSWWDKLRLQISKGQPVKLSSRMIHNPVSVTAVTEAVRTIIDNDIRNQNLHLGGLDRVSEVETGKALAEYFGLNPDLIQEVETSASASSLNDFSLNFSKSLSILKMKPRSLLENIQQIE